uniref:Reverse transcriptase Ty1/copia-type domain-containing protein n=1 Tax=Vitis vinifera TaxID=29760 RepID=A5AWX8_VITVI|nr:hypothetical protein VITISV_018826 [Vitis vinifera]
MTTYDSSLFFHTSVSGIILLLVYVDDIIITGTDCGLITKLQQLLHTTFHMKDLRQLTYFLGFEVHHRASDVRNKIVFLNPLLRSSTMPCLLLVLKLYGYAVFLRSLGFLRLLLHLFMLITLVLFRLPPIPFFMNGPSTLRLIVILFETPWKVG